MDKYKIICDDGSEMMMEMAHEDAKIDEEMIKLNQSLCQWVPPKKAISYELIK